MMRFVKENDQKRPEGYWNLYVAPRGVGNEEGQEGAGEYFDSFPPFGRPDIRCLSPHVLTLLPTPPGFDFRIRRVQGSTPQIPKVGPDRLWGGIHETPPPSWPFFSSGASHRKFRQVWLFFCTNCPQNDIFGHLGNKKVRSPRGRHSVAGNPLVDRIGGPPLPPEPCPPPLQGHMPHGQRPHVSRGGGVLLPAPTGQLGGGPDLRCGRWRQIPRPLR